jgi:hypothetical protein
MEQVIIFVIGAMFGFVLFAVLDVASHGDDDEE